MSGIVGIILNDKPILIYCVESDPNILGFEILNFIYTINSENGWDKFKNLSRNIIEEEEVHEYHTRGLFQLINMYNIGCTKIITDNTFIYNRYCDYGYIINLDCMVLEYYTGYQTTPQRGNRFGKKSDGEYYPSRLSSIYDLISIDSEGVIEDNIEDMFLLDGNIDRYDNTSSIYRKHKLKKLCNINALVGEQ